MAICICLSGLRMRDRLDWTWLWKIEDNGVKKKKRQKSRCWLELPPLAWKYHKLDFCHDVGQVFSTAMSLFHSLRAGKETKIPPFYLWFWISSPNPWLCAQQNPRAKFPVKAKHPVACLYYLSEDVQVQKRMGREKCLVQCKQGFPLIY